MMKGEQQKKEQRGHDRDATNGIATSQISILDDLHEYFLEYAPGISAEDEDWNTYMRTTHGVDAIVQRHIDEYRKDVRVALFLIDEHNLNAPTSLFETTLRDALRLGAPTLDNLADAYHTRPPPHLREEVGIAVDLEIHRVWRANLKRIRERIKEKRAIDKAIGKTKLMSELGVTKIRGKKAAMTKK